jgi:hypothetical protein
MLRKTMIVVATVAALTGGLTADAFARGAGGGGGHGGGFGGFAGGSMAFHGGFQAPMIRPPIARIHGAPFAHFRHRRSVTAGSPLVVWDDAPWYSGYYDASTIAPDEQPTYPAPVVTPPAAPNAYIVFNPHSGVPSEEPDLLRPGELLVRFPPPRKILR